MKNLDSMLPVGEPGKRPEEKRADNRVQIEYVPDGPGQRGPEKGGLPGSPSYEIGPRGKQQDITPKNSRDGEIDIGGDMDIGGEDM